MDRVISITNDSEDSSRFSSSVEAALEDLKMEVEDDHTRLLEDHEETIEEAQLEHEEIVGDQIDELENATSRYVGLLENFMAEYRAFMEENAEELEGLGLRRQRIIDGYASVIKDAREEYRKLIDDQVSVLEDLASHKRRGALYSFLAGSALLGAGLASAAAHPFADGLIDFYAESPGIYAEDPGTAVLTLGVPVAGAYLLKKAYDRTKEYQEIDERLDDLRELRLEERLDRSKEEAGEDAYTEFENL